MRTRVLVAATLVAFCIAVPAWADKGDVKLQVGVLYNLPTDDLTTTAATWELDDAFGFQFSFEFMVTDTVGIEPSLGFSNHDVRITDAGVSDFDLGDIDYRTLMANVNLYVLRKDKIRVYVGPTVGYVFWGDLETDFFGQPEKFAADGEVAFGVNAGLDAPFGSSKWAFSAALSYLFMDASLEGSAAEPDLDVDPLQLRVGVSFRF